MPLMASAPRDPGGPARRGGPPRRPGLGHRGGPADPARGRGRRGLLGELPTPEQTRARGRQPHRRPAGRTRVGTGPAARDPHRHRDLPRRARRDERDPPPGQLVAFFGYSTFLTTPLRTAIEYVIISTRAYVGAGRVLRILTIDPLVTEPDRPLPWPEQVERLDDAPVASRLAPRPARRVVTETPRRGVAPGGPAGSFRRRRRRRPRQRHAPRPRSRSPTCAAHIIVSEIEPRLFSGELRDELVPHGDARRTRAIMRRPRGDERARHPRRARRRAGHAGRGTGPRLLGRTAPAPEPRAGDADRGRRARPRRADVGRRHPHRGPHRGATARGPRAVAHHARRHDEPAALGAMDLVYLMVDGRVVDQGTHHELVDRSRAYRQIVLREDALMPSCPSPTDGSSWPTRGSSSASTGGPSRACSRSTPSPPSWR